MEGTCRYGACACTLLQVRMAPDNLTAFVLWDAFPDQADAAQREISRRYAIAAVPGMTQMRCRVPYLGGMSRG